MVYDDDGASRNANHYSVTSFPITTSRCCIPFLHPLQSGRSDTVDLNDSSLQVDISDALSEREKVKFTVHTKVSPAQPSSRNEY